MISRLLIVFGIIGVLLTGGCLEQPNLYTNGGAPADALIGLFSSLERAFPPPSFLEPYFESRQEVPLNNIPNADMENWSVAWTSVSGSGSTGYSGDIYFEGSSKYVISNPSCSPPANNYISKGPLFKLSHDYISFYGYCTTHNTFCQGNSFPFLGGCQSSIVVYDAQGTLILKKRIITTTPYNGVTHYTKVNPFDSTYSKGSFIGDDARTWYLITIPLPPYLIGQDISLGLEVGQLTTTPATMKVYVDNFYYSTSTGDEIYLLEAPTAQFTYVVNGYNVAVDANISQTAGTLYQIKWNWGDGTQTTGVESTHAYAFPGNKQITLTIMDNENLVDTATLVVSVDGTSYYAGPEGSNTAKLPPIAGFSYGLTGMTINVDGSYSKDDGTITLYTWDFDGVKKNGTIATHTYANAGTKTVTLTVTDNVGLEGERKITFDLPVGGVTTTTIVEDNPGIPPTAKFTYTLVTPTITVDASSSSDDVKIETYLWNWGDGSTSVGKTSSHTYSDMGAQRTIVLTVTDNEGFTDSAEILIATQSYDEPDDTDDDDSDVVTPPPVVISGGSTPVAPPATTNGFPVWGFFIFIVIFLALSVGIFMLFKPRAIKGSKRKIKRKGGKKR